jgi:alpha-N-arabinofuranosidase
MITTPTYHVFDLYQSHQGGTAIRLEVEGRDIKFAAGEQPLSMPAVSGSASVKNGRLTLSLIHVHPSRPAEVTIDLRGRVLRDVTVWTIADEDLTAHNTFEEPGRVVPVRTVIESAGPGWTIDLPPASVTVISGVC